MGISHVKEIARVMCRANIPLFVVGAHGIGKTSAVYQMYQEGADEFGGRQISAQAIAKSMIASGAITSEDAKDLDIDLKSLSSLDGKHLARAAEDPDAYGFWSMSGPNITLEELVGMPHVEDRGALYRDTYMRAQDSAATLLSHSEWESHEDIASLLTELTGRIFAGNCERLGITEDDRNHVVLSYLRMYGLMPDPRHRGGGVWLIDEPNRAFQEVEKALMQILLEHRYLDYVVPDGIWICMTMNPPGGDYQVRDMDMATLDRGAVVTINSDKDEFLTWASRRGLDESTQVFVDKHSDMLNRYERDIDMSSIDNAGTFRSMEFVHRAYAAMTDEERSRVGASVAKSLLGSDAGMLYHKTVTENVHKALDADEVITGYGWRDNMTDEEERDYKAWTVTRSRIRLQGMVKKTNVKSELVRYTLKELLKWMESLHTDVTDERDGTSKDPKLTREERGGILNVLLFLIDLPADISRGFVMDDMKPFMQVLLSWTGVQYPVTKALHVRVNKDYDEIVEYDANSSNND